MKTISVISLISLFMAFFLSSPSIAGGETAGEYVYVLELKGGSSWVTYPAVGGKKETPGEAVRGMRVIYPGAILEIEEGASVSLVRGGGKAVVNLSHKDSPYTVKMTDFQEGGSIISDLARNLYLAITYFVYPDSEPLPQISTGVRGLTPDPCKGLWPPNNAKIMATGEPVTFKWLLHGGPVSLEIKESDSTDTIYSITTPSNKTNVPTETLAPGRRYKWSLKEKETGGRCDAAFELLSREDSARIMNTLHDLSPLLPAEADTETRYRLQAGYLYSQGLIYDAWQWLERNGVSQK